MKAILYISIPALFLASSCATSGFRLGGEYDDLYYSSSDKETVTQSVVGN